MNHPFFFIARHGVYNLAYTSGVTCGYTLHTPEVYKAGICMSARIDYDINASVCIAMTISILSGGHPHPILAHT